MTNRSFSGIIPPVITPFTESGKYDEESAKILIDNLLESEVDALFFLGSIGEFSQLSLQMKKEIADFVISYIDGRVPVLIGTGSNTIKESVEFSQYVESIGGDGIVVISPYYWKLSDEELLHYFDSIAKSVSIPMMLYNFPDRTGHNLTSDFIVTLVEKNPNIVGIKDTVDSIAHIKELIVNVTGRFPNFSVLCGYDDHLLNTLFMGGAGGIVGSSNFAPGLFTDLCKAYKAGDFAELKALNDQILKVSGIYSNGSSILSTIKEALIQQGLDINPASLVPFKEVSEAEKSKIRETLESLDKINT